MPMPEIKVSIGEGVRRLPVYLLLDCSGSMAGAPIEAVRRGLEAFVGEVRTDPFASQTVHVGLITFGASVQLLTNGLVPFPEFASATPTLPNAEGQTPYGEALRQLQKSMNSDVRPIVPGGEKGDWKPLVFVLTDGAPTDDWRTAREEIAKRQERKLANVITVGCGHNINDQTLKEMAIGPTFRMDTTEESFRTFFQWVTQSVKTVSRAFTQPGGDQQPAAVAVPNPQVIQFVP